MKKKITRMSLWRAFRTFIQVAIPAFVAGGYEIAWGDVDIPHTLLSLGIVSVFAGLNALVMNREKIEE